MPETAATGSYQPREAALQIELYGALNPAIFKPAWFRDQNLLRASEVGQAEVSVDDDDFMQFQLPDLLIDVTRNRFALLSRNEALNLTHRDLVASLFEVLRHTPLRSLTISRFAWFEPPQPDAILNWGPVAKHEFFGDLLKRPTVDRVTIVGSPSIGEYQTELTVEDSTRSDAPLLVRCVYSRDLPDESSTLGPELEKDWGSLYDHSDAVMARCNDTLWQARI